MNAFECLGLLPRLSLDESELTKIVTNESRRHHPDAGGRESDFQDVRRAGEILAVPAMRIREALIVAGGAPSERGSVPIEVMDLFSPVAKVLEEVSEFVVSRGKALSGLGRAVIDAQLPALKSKLEALVARVSALEDGLIARFPVFDEQGWEHCLEEMEEVARGLAFLGKWQRQLREASGRLFEALLGG